MKRVFLYVFLFVCSIFISSCDTFSSGRDNTLPPSPLVKFTPQLQVTKLWSTRVGDGANRYYLRMQPAVTKYRVFAASYNGRVCAVDTNSGKIWWKVDTGMRLTSGVYVDAGRLFVGTEDGSVLALSVKDGHNLWMTSVGSTILATPTVEKSIVLVKSIDGSLVALAAKNGKLIWRFKQTVPSLILHASSQPQFAGGLAIAGFANGRLAVLGAWTGKPLWVNVVAQSGGITDIQNMVDIDVSPVVVKGIVYVATYQGYIVAFDLKTGQEIWRHKISSYAGIAADYSTIYLSDARSKIWAFDEDGGASLWRQTKLQGRMITGPAVIGRYIVVADAYGYLHWLAKHDGSFVARNNLGSGVLTPPVVYGNRVYVYARDGRLMAFGI